MADNRDLEERMSEEQLEKAFTMVDKTSSVTSPVRELLRETDLEKDPDKIKKLVDYTLYALKEPRKQEAAILFSRFYKGDYHKGKGEKKLLPEIIAILKERLTEEDKERIKKFLREKPMLELNIKQQYPEFEAAVYGKTQELEDTASKPTESRVAPPSQTSPRPDKNPTTQTGIRGGAQTTQSSPRPQVSEPPQSGQKPPTGGAKTPIGFTYGIPDKDAARNLRSTKQSAAPTKQSSNEVDKSSEHPKPGFKPGSEK